MILSDHYMEVEVHTRRWRSWSVCSMCPALETAVRYDRSTGYFSATALTLAARGIEGLVRNNGRMRLVVGCTLAQAEIDAIEKGQKLRDAVEQKTWSCIPRSLQTKPEAVKLLNCCPG